MTNSRKLLVLAKSLRHVGSDDLADACELGARLIEQAEPGVSEIAREVALIVSAAFPALGKPDLSACRSVAVEMHRFRLPSWRFALALSRLLAEKRHYSPDWQPEHWGWVRVVLAEEARREGKIHVGEVQIEKPPAALEVERTGGKVVGMYRPRLKGQR